MSVLLVGNGINLQANLAEKWEDLFQKAVNVKGFEVKTSLSMTLEFELNVCRLLKLATAGSNPIIKNEFNVKQKIAEHILAKQNSLPVNWKNTVHSRLLDCGFDTILTTNYDYFLELALDQYFTPQKYTRETTYSQKRFHQIDSTRIFHIHGEARRPMSICLGFEQYSGSLQKIRANITHSTEKEGDGRKFQLFDVLMGYSPMDNDLWYYNFFTEDVYILGFGLDTSELDIWWLLNYRAKFLREYPRLKRNDIFYLETDREKKGEDLLSKKHQLLEAFGVKVQDCTSPRDGGNYGKRYDKALKFLEGRNHRKFASTGSPE